MVRKAIICSLFFGGLGTCAAGEVDLTGIALKITVEDIGKEEWARHTRVAVKQYNTWLQDNPSGDLKRFLDDRLLARAVWVPTGKHASLKRFIYWLALYEHFKEPTPAYIRRMAQKHGQWFETLPEDFSWDRFSRLVTSKTKAIKAKDKALRDRKAKPEAVYAGPPDKTREPKPSPSPTSTESVKVFTTASK